MEAVLHSEKLNVERDEGCENIEESLGTKIAF